MSSQDEPSDGHMYSWLSLNNDTIHFYLASIKFYEKLLEEDVDAIKEDNDLAFLLSDKEKHRLGIYQEIKQVSRARVWLEKKIQEQGADAWDYDITMAHRTVRFFKSVGLLYIRHLKNRRNVLSSKPKISKCALQAVDQRISYFEEKTEIGVFRNATPHQLYVRDLDAVEGQSANRGSDDSTELGMGTSLRPRPHLIDSIEILDPELKSRCLDLFHKFQEDEQNERLDTVVTEATRILETKLRKVSNAPDDCVGVELARFALSGNAPPLTVSEITSEQEAAHLLFRGVFGYIRNPVHHHLIENLRPGRVLQIIGMIDYLLFIVQDANMSETESRS